MMMKDGTVPEAARRMSMPPHVESWLHEQLGEMDLGRLRDLPLVAVAVAVGRARRSSRAVVLPDNVLKSWALMLDDKRREADQSELVFIEQAQHQGWSGAEIAEVLRLEETVDLNEHQGRLSVQVQRRYPGA